jgi:hypothetical protein
MYEVFRRPATGADELPALDSSAPLDEFGTTIDPDRARLLFERGDTRVYAVAASRRDRPSVCVLEVVGEAQARSTCRLIEENPGLGGTVTYLPVLVDGRAAIAALGADDVHELEIEFPGGEVARHEFKNSTVLAPADPWPSGLHYVNDAGGSVFMDVLPEDNPAG